MKKRRHRHRYMPPVHNYDRWDLEDNLEEAQNLASVGLMRPGAPGKLLEGGGANDARNHSDADVLKTRKVGRRSRPAKAGHLFTKWLPEMDSFISDNYRPVNRKNFGFKGWKAEDIAKYLARKFNEPGITKNAIIGRYHRKFRRYRKARSYDRPDSPSVSPEAPRTPSLPKLKFLGDEQ